MKKFTKILLIVILVLGVSGVVLLIGGMASGASPVVFLKNIEKQGILRNWIGDRKEISEEEWDRLEERWEEEWDSCWGNPHKERSDYQDREWVHSDSIKAEEIQGLYVEAMAGSVELETVQGEEIRFSGVYDTDQIYRENNALHIQREESGSQKLTIQIPENKKFEEVFLYSYQGNLSVQGRLKAREASLDTDQGNLTVELLEGEDIGLECLSGNLKVTCAGTQEDYQGYLENFMGNVTLAGELESGQYEKRFGSRDKEKRIEISSDGGNLELEFEKKI